MSSVKKMSSLEETLFEVLTCPVCLTYAAPPFQMCMNSHITCSECFRKLLNCPTCRAAMSTGRVLILEKIYENLEISCKYEGCSFKCQGKNIKDHEESCNFLPVVCPLGYEFKCTWNGTLYLLPDHLMAAHPKSVFFSTPQKLSVKNFANIRGDLHFHLMFCVYEKVFMLRWSLVNSLLGVRLTMFEIGNRNPERPDRFQFALHFSSDLDAEDNDTNRVHMSAGITRDNVVFTERKFQYGSVFTLDYALLLNVCQSNGDLNYKVVIKKIEKPSENDTYCKIWKSEKQATTV